MKIHSILDVKTSCSVAIFYVYDLKSVDEIEDAIVKAWDKWVESLPEGEKENWIGKDILGYLTIGFARHDEYDRRQERPIVVRENSEWDIPADFRQPLADAISNGEYGQE